MRHPFRFLIKDSPLYSALLVERFLPGRVRHFLIAATRALTILFLTLISLTPWVELFHYFGYGLDWWSAVLTKLFGFLFFTLALWIFFSAGEMFYRSHFRRSLARPEYLVTLDVGRVLYSAQSEDLLAAFLQAPTGQAITARAGIVPGELATFFHSREVKTLTASLSFKPGELLNLSGLATLLWQSNKDWQDFLTARVIPEEAWRGTVAWVEKASARHFAASRWWSRENLDRIPGLAKDWAYGETPHLNRYSSEWSRIPGASVFHEAERAQLETILAREVGRDALLIGGTKDDKLAVLGALAMAIRTGKVAPELEHKRLIYFQTEVFISNFRERAAFEQELTRVLTEAKQAGNIILVLDDLAGLLAAGEDFGAQLENLLEPYLRARDVQLVALLSTAEFNRRLSGNPDFLNRFERVSITEPNAAEILSLLEVKVEGIEAKLGLTFTYPALTELITAAERYFTDETLGEKAEDLIDEIISWSQHEKIKVLTHAAATDFLRTKTGLPLGELNTDERARLMGLGDLLQARVVGQQAAIEALVNVLKRSRLGVRNPKRPVASLLFLGPTGVGKTETAKALAQVFFGGEDKLIRLDMTEYEAAEAVERLLGSFALGKPGMLATLVRQQPYGVILLDEFEKTRPEILDLFLQILDEGFFTDALGKRVNTRNLIFIATSNAGSDFIWQLLKDNKPAADWQKSLIDELVKRGTFKPELLNRFDSTIIFEPLNPTTLTGVAKIILTRLAERLKAQGITLSITEPLLNQVVSSGANQMFGARPMVRFVQDHVEQVVADKLVAGELKPGNTIAFRAAQTGERTAPDFALVAEIS